MNFNYAIFTVLKEVILKNSNPFEFFPYLTPLKKYIYKIYAFFNSAHNILDIFYTHFDYTNRCRMGHNKEKLVMFFPQKAETTNKLSTKI